MEAAARSVLVIDDSPDDREFFSGLLTKDRSREWNISECGNGQEGLRLLRDQPFDCVLLDYSLPGANGLRVLNELRLENLTVPVIILTGQGNEQIAVDCLKNGAQDYMCKDQASPTTLLNAINNAIAHRKHELMLIRRASCDALTGLPSRHTFMDELSRAIARANRNKKSCALIFADLDQFKQINDTYGHVAGDILLQEVAARLKQCVRECDTLARLGGDEFVILLEELSDGVQSCNIVTGRIIESICQQPFILHNHSVSVQISMGIALYPQMARTREELLEIADRGMYANKRSAEQFAHLAHRQIRC